MLACHDRRLSEVRFRSGASRRQSITPIWKSVQGAGQCSSLSLSPVWFKIRSFWVTEGERKRPACEGRMADFGWIGSRLGEANSLPQIRCAEADVVRGPAA